MLVAHMTLRILGLTAIVLVPILLSTCVHPAVVPVAIAVPVVILIIPLRTDDDATFCVQTALGAGINPGDVLPLRCASVGAVRAWIRAQRWAN